MTTLGVIGLGRIGAFHTETLSGLPGGDGDIVVDEGPARNERGPERAGVDI